MPNWDAVLRRDTETWQGFLDWLKKQRQREVDRMLTVPAAEHDFQRGIVAGIDAVIFQATAAEREEGDRARRSDQY